MSKTPVTEAHPAHSLGDSIRRLRIARGLTQQQLGDLLGVEQQAISAWEHGHSHPRRALLRPLADALDVHVSTLFADYAA